MHATTLADEAALARPVRARLRLLARVGREIAREAVARLERLRRDFRSPKSQATMETQERE